MRYWQSLRSERGPLGDSSSGSGLSFLLGPVPMNPQNRDAIVASSAGHGYYGTTPTSGGGGRGRIMGGGGPGRGMHHELVVYILVVVGMILR